MARSPDVTGRLSKSAAGARCHAPTLKGFWTVIRVVYMIFWVVYRFQGPYCHHRKMATCFVEIFFECGRRRSKYFSTSSDFFRAAAAANRLMLIFFLSCGSRNASKTQTCDSSNSSVATNFRRKFVASRRFARVAAAATQKNKNK